MPTTRAISDGLRNLLLNMLQKDPSARATLDELKRDKWLNQGFAVSLDSKEADFFANYSEEDLKRKGVPLTAVVYAV